MIATSGCQETGVDSSWWPIGGGLYSTSSATQSSQHHYSYSLLSPWLVLAFCWSGRSPTQRGASQFPAYSCSVWLSSSPQPSFSRPSSLLPSHTSQRIVGIEPHSIVSKARQQLSFHLASGCIVHALQQIRAIRTSEGGLASLWGVNARGRASYLMMRIQTRLIMPKMCYHLMAIWPPIWSGSVQFLVNCQYCWHRLPTLLKCPSLPCPATNHHGCLSEM